VSGGFFEKGEVLLRIDPHDYELALTRIEAEVAQAGLQLEQEKARLQLPPVNGRNWAAAKRHLQMMPAEYLILEDIRRIFNKLMGRKIAEDLELEPKGAVESE
jgi:multidrug resistance efflux pump